MPLPSADGRLMRRGSGSSRYCECRPPTTPRSDSPGRRPGACCGQAGGQSRYQRGERGRGLVVAEAELLTELPTAPLFCVVRMDSTRFMTSPVETARGRVVRLEEPPLALGGVVLLAPSPSSARSTGRRPRDWPGARHDTRDVGIDARRMAGVRDRRPCASAALLGLCRLGLAARADGRACRGDVPEHATLDLADAVGGPGAV